MRILIVEDSPTDTALLKYLLEDKFKDEAKFREATSLDTAFRYLLAGNIDCVLLDLQLPDSAGKETFVKINERFPDVPIIVMTHNADRDLAIEMIQAGAADYILKNFSNEEDIFRRIVFAVEKHKRTVKAPTETVASFHKVERAAADLKTAHESGQHGAIRETTVETTSAIAELSKNIFAGMQELTSKVTQSTVTLERLLKSSEALETEVLKGETGKPSMKSRLDILEHRMNEVSSFVKELKDDVQEAEDNQRLSTVQVTQTKITSRTKVIVAICTLLGIIVSGVTTYAVARYTDKTPTEKAK